jgi:GNAT superfamily N-acetyltransferase
LPKVLPIRPQIALRDATLADIPALSDLFRRSSLSNDGDRAALLANPSVLELSPQSVIEGRTRVTVVDGTRVVGFATTARNDDGLELEDLFVDPDWMRMGIGRALVADALLLAGHLGLRCIDVTANPHALDFYRKVGVCKVGSVATALGQGHRMHINLVQ